MAEASVAVLGAGAHNAVRAQRVHSRRWRLTQVLSAAWLFGLVVGMFLLPSILGLDSQKMVADHRLDGPTASNWLGADNLGRDLLARTLAGARVSLLIGLGSVLIGALAGVPLGMVAGHLRGRVDAMLSFLFDVLLAFPVLVLALALTSLLGASVGNVMVAVTVVFVPVFFRLARAQTLSVAQREYVEASRVLGAGTTSVLLREVLPNIRAGLIAFALVSVGHAVLIEGGLSFLGMGVPQPEASWGSMINFGRTFIASGPLMIAVPSAFMLATILSLNVLAERFANTAQAGGRS